MTRKAFVCRVRREAHARRPAWSREQLRYRVHRFQANAIATEPCHWLRSANTDPKIFGETARRRNHRAIEELPLHRGSRTTRAVGEQHRAHGGPAAEHFARTAGAPRHQQSAPRPESRWLQRQATENEVSSRSTVYPEEVPLTTPRCDDV